MSEKYLVLLTKDPQKMLLTEMAAQRDTLELQLAIMDGQITMQKLFVNTHTAVLTKGMRKLFDAEFD